MHGCMSVLATLSGAASAWSTSIALINLDYSGNEESFHIHVGWLAFHQQPSCTALCPTHTTVTTSAVLLLWGQSLLLWAMRSWLLWVLVSAYATHKALGGPCSLSLCPTHSSCLSLDPVGGLGWVSSSMTGGCWKCCCSDRETIAWQKGIAMVMAGCGQRFPKASSAP